MTTALHSFADAAQDAATQIAALNAALAQLDASSRNFAQSLITQYNARGRLTERQWPHVGRLIERANNVQTPRTHGEPLPAAGLVQLTQRFAHATAQGIRASIRTPVARISTPSARSRYAGQPTLFVRYNDTYVGRIEGGNFCAVPGSDPSALHYLRELLESPVDNLAAIGRETGTCCYCARELTDPRSVQVGYGPICAGHYGLPWGDGLPVVPAPSAAERARANAAYDIRRDQRRAVSDFPAPTHTAPWVDPLPTAAANTHAVAPDQPDEEDRQFFGSAQ